MGFNMTVHGTGFSAFIRNMWWLLFLLSLGQFQVSGQLLDTDFQPTVTATCKAGFMTIRVNLNESFVGAVHAKDKRMPPCMVVGNGSKQATLGINLLAQQGAPDYCGVHVNNHTDERSLQIVVRIHKTLELADDKFYVITCGKAGFPNSKNETSTVSLSILDNDGRRVKEAVFSHNYTLRAEISRPDGIFGMRVKSCFVFSATRDPVYLSDERGCPTLTRGITKFTYDKNTGIADATIITMFKLTDHDQVHLQCNVAVCRGSCGVPVCDGDPPSTGLKGREEPVGPEESSLLVGTSVFILMPGEMPRSLAVGNETIHPQWLLWLAIAFGILFLIMLIINIFLCSAMSCSCARTEIIEKEPSIIEDYDPYRSWPGSQYGSRYSLNGKPGYPSGGSTMNSTRSISTNSDHYAIVHSRPGSRYSGPGHKHHHHHHRGPPSNIGSHYSAK
ncbi:uncharacterized protein LOC107044707 [Diachasma alloeum]|uniref:uncharacterized protein LOC107044707 n=1 Tax=Diachasma alloeum TaxID=454923 RepID=UPI0007384A19|nr:uncharacterized protein LOC107044707 [Diachasma alloeum]